MLPAQTPTRLNRILARLNRGGAIVSVMTMVLVGCVSAQTPSTGASYLFNGLHPTTGPYSGSLDVSSGDSGISLDWLAADKSGREGYALQLDKVIGGVAAEGEDGLGIVLYRVNGGRLEGIWNSYGTHSGAMGRENLEGPEGLNGAYKITLGQNRNKSRYKGDVRIRKTSQTYLVDWSTPGSNYIGTGLLVDDVFVVAYAARRRPTVWAACMDGPVLIGVTASGEAGDVAAELLWPIKADIPADIPARLAKVAADAADGAIACGHQPVAKLSQTAH